MGFRGGRDPRGPRHVDGDHDPVGDRHARLLAQVVDRPDQLAGRALDPKALVDFEVEGDRPRPLAGEGEVFVLVGSQLDVLGVQPLACDLHPSLLVERRLERGPVGVGQGLLDLVHPLAQPGAERVEVGHGRPRHELGQAGHVLQVLDVELLADLLPDLGRELDVGGVHEEGPLQGLTGADLGVGAGGPPQPDELTGAGHGPGEGGVGGSGGDRPVGRVHRELAGETDVDLVGQVRGEGRQQLGGRHQAAIEGGVGSRVRRAPEPSA